LYHWRKQAKARGLVVPGDGKNPENWSPEDKFAVVLETASFNEAELAEYCRKKGLYAEQIVAWKRSCIQGMQQRLSMLSLPEKNQVSANDC
jgi:transposase-like protein